MKQDEWSRKSGDDAAGRWIADGLDAPGARRITYQAVATGCWSLCIVKSRNSLPASIGSGRNRSPQIEQEYSPVHTLLPSRFVITALRQTFLAGILKAYRF